MAQQASEIVRSAPRGPRLRGLAFRLLGSLDETDTAVRQASEREGSSDETDLAVARLCLDTLSRRAKAPRDDWHVPDLVVTTADQHTPEQLELLAGSVGSVLYVTLDALSAHERVAFVLHDGYGLEVDRIADVLGLPATAVTALTDRARAAVGEPLAPDGDLRGQRAVLDAFFKAVRAGDEDAVRSMIRPDAVLRADAGGHAMSAVVEGAEQMARRAVMLGRVRSTSHHVLINNAAGSVVTAQGQVAAVLAFTVVGGQVAEIDEIAAPVRVAALGVEALLR
ncbi:sigma factor-like helix-turn-helix DNA-binding protein [Cellulomonas sp. URHD0024]|uniref:sigma factor-like helix-turn-helix DNA-binding protein n=1 Tax=Cellulomonas sp. URHD0024 TaxID=1302620 RepID=UPI000684DA26|nr:sigma factor-like helix-turn-helix DNA-binding protein [Cellulomonas sp. URHD0024]